MKMEMVLMLGMMLMMISMMPVTMATISPSGRCSPRRNLPTGDVFFFSVGFRHEAAAKHVSPLFLGFSPRGDDIGQRGRQKWDQGPKGPPGAPYGAPRGR